MPRDELVHRKRQWAFVAGATLVAVPAFLMRSGLAGRIHPDPGVIETLIFGLGILGAAFLLSWGAEVAQLDISQGLAIAFLAFIAVLPEYAVDLVFAWKGGSEDSLAALQGLPDPCALAHQLGTDCRRELAIANMTGANRLLIGIGWATVVLVWWRRSGEKHVKLAPASGVDIGFLLLATLWALSIVVRREAMYIDSIGLVAMFVWYVWHAAKEESEHPELIGPPVAIAALGKTKRRATTLVMFVFAAIAILICAEPFAEGLVHMGTRFDLDRFLLVQRLAPLASEAPEMIIALLFVLRAKPDQGLGTLVSAKVNQWTLLIGTVPLVYAISFGDLTHAFALSDQQVVELLLTATQSLFAIAVIANLRIERGEAGALLGLFIAQFVVGALLSESDIETPVRYGFSALYLILFLLLLLREANRANMWRALKQALSKPGRSFTPVE